MQKKLIALAVAGITAGPAFAADTSVTLYGLVDGGYSYRSSNYTASTSSRSGFDTGMGNGSRLGVKGEEDIGGLKATFQLEAGINLDTGTSAQGTDGKSTTAAGVTTVNTEKQDRVWGRVATVGVKTDSVGALTIGRQYTPLYDAYASTEPFGLGNVGQANNIFKHITSRADNSLKWVSPQWGGVFGVTALYSSKIDGAEAAGNVGDKRSYEIYPKLTYGPATFIVGYQEFKVKSAALKDSSMDGLLLLKFSMVTLDAGYSRLSYDATKPQGAAEHDRFTAGVAVPVGAVTLKASYNYSKDKEDKDIKAQQFALGARYALSKRTDFYATYSQIQASDNAEAGKYYDVGDGSNSGLGYKRGIDMGIKHVF